MGASEERDGGELGEFRESEERIQKDERAALKSGPRCIHQDKDKMWTYKDLSSCELHFAPAGFLQF